MISIAKLDDPGPMGNPNSFVAFPLSAFSGCVPFRFRWSTDLHYFPSIVRLSTSELESRMLEVSSVSGSVQASMHAPHP